MDPTKAQNADAGKDEKPARESGVYSRTVVNLEWHDLEEIIRIFQDEGCGYRIFTGENTYESLYQIDRERKNTLMMLHIYGTPSAVSVVAFDKQATVYVSGKKDVDTLRLAARLTEYLKGRRIRLSLRRTGARLWVPWGCLCAPILIIVAFVLALICHSFAIGTACLVIVAVTLVMSVIALPWPVAAHLRYLKDRPSFWERNRDTIIKDIIVLLVGMAVGWFADDIKKRLSGKQTQPPVTQHPTTQKSR